MSSALIIGGTSGLGQAIAIQAVRRRMQTTIAGRSAGAQRSEEPRELLAVFRWALDLARESSEDANVFQPPAFTEHALSEESRYLFWVAGIGQETGLAKLSDAQIDQVLAVHQNGPIKVINNLHKLLFARRWPYHLVIVSSSAGVRARENAELHSTVQAGRVEFAIQWARRMHADLPGSRVTLLMPGKMAVPSLRRANDAEMRQLGTMADQAWRLVLGQESRFRAYTIPCSEDGRLGTIISGLPMPEPPFTDEMP